MDNYQNYFEKALVTIAYDMIRLKSKMFLPVGLELNSTNIILDRDDTFKLKGFTFAYYNPINNSIHINIDDPFFKNCKNDIERNSKLFFILYHETMHKILMHSERCNDRKHDLWNIAADYEIHNMYYVFSKTNISDQLEKNILHDYMHHMIELMINKSISNSPENPKFMFDENYIDNIAEEIYEKIINSEEISSETIDMNMSDLMQNDNNGNEFSNADMEDMSNIPVKVTKTKYKLPDGSNYTSVDIQWPEENKLPDNLKKDEKSKERAKQTKLTNKSLLENTLDQMVKEKGALPADCQKFLKKLFHIKVDWVKILRNSLQTVFAKSDYFAWSKVRTSAFLLPNMAYLPDIVEDTEKYGTLIISRDESGSMTDDAISKAAEIIMDAKAHYKKIILIKHDHEISKIEEFDELTEENIKSLFTRERCGGTSHKEVFEYIAEYYKTHRYEDKISCYIGLTDMESDIETYQNIIPADVPVIYLAPMDYDNNRYKDVKGQVIPIEL